MAYWDTPRLIDVRTQLIVDRTNEVQPFRDWLSNSRPLTSIWSICGIGGIGKTTFLGQIQASALAQGVPCACVDGHLHFQNMRDVLVYILTQLNIPQIHEQLSLQDMIGCLVNYAVEHKLLILFDHFEEMMPLEPMVRTDLVASLPVTGVLMAFASRQPLPMRWWTDPGLMALMNRVTLGNFTWEQSMDYTRRAGITQANVQQQISRQTSGYPLALAFTVQSLLQQTKCEEMEKLASMQEISADLIREVVPHLSDLVEGLAFVRTATQDLLSEVLEDDVPTAYFRELGRLSFVRATPTGLVIHDVVRSYLLEDLKVRNPQRFRKLFRKTVEVLGTRVQGASDRVTYVLLHNLITLCAFEASVLAFPHPSISSQISARPLPQCEFMTETDIDGLHGLLETGMVTSAMIPGKLDHHMILDYLIQQYPESLRILRRGDGRPAAFAVFLPLYREVIDTLPRSVLELIQDGLGKELDRYRSISRIDTDTILSLISCVGMDTGEFTFADLLLALKLTGWLELIHGRRCLLFS
ncbi:MAG: hypothetical protein K6T83_16790, partial [Alicyclobacillus sp.]|nr:hypothetical protein [Alicyclobacillus sp.]